MNNNNIVKQNVSISLDSDIIIQTKKLAVQSSRSFSQYINHLLKLHITKIQNKNSNSKSD